VLGDAGEIDSGRARHATTLGEEVRVMLRGGGVAVCRGMPRRGVGKVHSDPGFSLRRLDPAPARA
jgi:hypothetical protein